jgi:hypothetical protein
MRFTSAGEMILLNICSLASSELPQNFSLKITLAPDFNL